MASRAEARSFAIPSFFPSSPSSAIMSLMSWRKERGTQWSISPSCLKGTSSSILLFLSTSNATHRSPFLRRIVRVRPLIRLIFSFCEGDFDLAAATTDPSMSSGARAAVLMLSGDRRTNNGAPPMQCVNPRSSLELRRQLAAVTTEGKTATPAPAATAAVREIFSNFPGVTVLRRRTRNCRRW